MISKIVIATAVLAVAAAQYHGGYGHGHGAAVSSQNIVLHQGHGQQQRAPLLAHSYQPAVVLQHQQPTHYVSQGHNVDYHAPAHYAFQYSVNDPHTGDIKSQQESREGDAVHGSYSLHEADGTVRRVEYTADAHSGFNAVVHREGHAAHAAPAPAHQPAHLAYHH